ncbi:hypothetical protein ADK70_04705 [Streptomyces rimosus subsp. pseudoverticillatus]|uniref:hypothetical protein n=1 Tax=Streptomyces rimosus TaxID=1927 RepID=UPI0006B29711|nr:hypothetical protein [Streptomyces rimosus]KOT99145.1 hypothetical protein ADK70_04705 [Streptomyces rimosus subsp. pseudoverticillatus]
MARVAGPASPGIEGTPRQPAAADIRAGAVTAESLSVDALTGKHLVGGRIDGAIVTGSTVRTGADGNRVVVIPTPPAPLQQALSALLHSASDLEKAPGALRANTKSDGTAFPTVELTTPAVQIDRWNLTDTSTLHLRSPQLNERGGPLLPDRLHRPRSFLMALVGRGGPSSELGTRRAWCGDKN